MTWRPCTHKTIDDHSEPNPGNGTRRVWICSKCGVRKFWNDGWKYFGNIECFTCQRQAIDIVLCDGCEP